MLETLRWGFTKIALNFLATTDEFEG